MTERQIQNEFVKSLRDLGFRVYVTSNRRKTANTEGTPDVFVGIDDVFYIGCELKAPKGKIREKQTGSLIVRDAEKGVKDVLRKIARLYWV